MKKEIVIICTVLALAAAGCNRSGTGGAGGTGSESGTGSSGGTGGGTANTNAGPSF